VQSFSATFTFDNTASGADDVGFAPFIDVLLDPVVDVSGGVTGRFLNRLDVVASSPVTFGSSGLSRCVRHPFLFASLGFVAPTSPDFSVAGVPTPTPGWVCGAPGVTFFSLRLPFSSFGSATAPAPVVVPLTVTGVAADGTGFISANAGFVYGGSVDFNNAPIIGGGGVAVAEAFMARKRISAALLKFDLEDDFAATSATFPATAFNYSLKFNPADGIEFIDGQFAMDLANSVSLSRFFVSDGEGGFELICTNFTSLIASPPGCVWFGAAKCRCIKALSGPGPCTLAAPAECGGGQLVCTYESFSGVVEARVEVLPRQFDSNGVALDNGENSNAVDMSSSVSVSGRTRSVGDSGSGTVFTASETSSRSRGQLVLAKARTRLVSGADGVPGSIHEYTLAMQLSNNHSYNNLILDDVIEDGMRFDATFTPLLVVNGTSPVAFGATNFVANLANADGTQDIQFRISDQLVDGGVASGAAFGPATVNVVYHAEVLDKYDAALPPVTSLFGGDCLNNRADLDSQQVQPADPSIVLLPLVARSASAQISVPTGVLTSSLFAVNGQLCSIASNAALCTQVKFPPLTQFTFNVTQTFPTDAFRELKIAQAFPIPLFDISGLQFGTTPDGNAVPLAAHACSGTPALGKICFNTPLHTLDFKDPVFSVDLFSMRWQLDYGTAESPAVQTAHTFSVLLTVELSSTPWIDEFDVVTFEEKFENAGSSCVKNPLAFQLFRQSTPKLCVTSGVVSHLTNDGATTDSAPDSRFLAGSPLSSPFATTVTEASLLTGATGPAPSNVDAGDTLRMAVFVINAGNHDAFDVKVELNTTDGMVVFALNPALTRAFFATNRSELDASMFAVDTVVSGPSFNVTITRLAPKSMVVVVYDVTATNAIRPGEAQRLPEAHVSRYVAQQTRPEDFVTTLHRANQYDRECIHSRPTFTGADAVVSAPTLTSSADSCTVDSVGVAVGEEFTLESVVALPRGTLRDASFTFRFSGAVADLVVVSATLAYTALPPPPSISTSVLPITVNLGDIVVGGTVVAPTLTLTAVLRATNVPANVDNRVLEFVPEFVFRLNDTDASTLSVTRTGAALELTLLRQSLQLSSRNNATGGIVEELAFVEFCFDVARARDDACAYDTVIQVTLPSTVPAPLTRSLLPRVVFTNETPVPTDGALSSTGDITVSIPFLDALSPPFSICFDTFVADVVTGVPIDVVGSLVAGTVDNPAFAAQTPDDSTTSVKAELTSRLATETSDSCTVDSDVTAGENVTLAFSRLRSNGAPSRRLCR
jgi:hypothetical protein